MTENGPHLSVAVVQLLRRMGANPRKGNRGIPCDAAGWLKISDILAGLQGFGGLDMRDAEEIIGYLSRIRDRRCGSQDSHLRYQYSQS